MKKVLMIFIGFLLLMMMFGAMFCVSAIYDASLEHVVEPYFFQTNSASERRPGTPQTPSELGDTEMINNLIAKYLMEYFSVFPDSENIAQRQQRTSTLVLMSAQNVYNDWAENIAPELEDMAAKKVLRFAYLDDVPYKPDDSDYWIVKYKLVTWDTPNNFTVSPQVSYGIMYMNIAYETGVRPLVDEMGMHQFLEQYKPEALFRFKVYALELR